MTEQDSSPKPSILDISQLDLNGLSFPKVSPTTVAIKLSDTQTLHISKSSASMEFQVVDDLRNLESLTNVSGVSWTDLSQDSRITISTPTKLLDETVRPLLRAIQILDDKALTYSSTGSDQWIIGVKATVTELEVAVRETTPKSNI